MLALIKLSDGGISYSECMEMDLDEFLGTLEEASKYQREINEASS